MLRNPCILGEPQCQEWGQTQKWLPHPCLLGGQEEGGIATQPLHSRRSPTPRAETSSEVATSTVPYRDPERGRNCYVIATLLGTAMARTGTKPEVVASPPPSRGPKRGRHCYVTPAFSGGPNPKSRDKIRSGYLTLALTGTQKRAATSVVPSREPTRGRNRSVNPAFSGLPNAKNRDKMKRGYLTLAFSRAKKRAQLLPNPCILRDPQPQVRGKKSELPTSPLPSWGPQKGRNCYVTLHSRGTAAPRTGTKSEAATSTLPLWGPTTGRNCYVTPAFSGVPNAKRADKIKRGYLIPAFSGPRRGPSCYLTAAFSRIPKPKRADKIRSGYLTPAFSGAQKKAELPRKPYLLGGAQPQEQKQNQKWLPHPCLLWGTKEGGIST